MDNHSEIVVVLTARQYLYKLFYGLFGDEPSEQLLSVAAEDFTRDALELFIGEEPAPLGIESFLCEAAQCKESWGEMESKLKSLYTKLFIGPGRLPVDPWESVFLGAEPILFQKVTLEVRKAYLGQGFLPAEYPKVADDNLAIELDFMANLAKRAVDAFATNDMEMLIKTIDASSAFLEEHLLKWVGAYSSKMAQTGAVLYPAAARACSEFLKADLQALNEIAETIPR